MNPETAIVQANNIFCQKFYDIWSCKKRGNIFFAPISIHAALSMLYQGAQGETAQILANTLKTPDVKSAAEGYKAAMQRLNAFKQITLLVANKIYGVDSHIKFLEEFESSILENFQGEVGIVGVQDAKKAAEDVNKWVEEKTKNNIKNVVNEKVFKENQSLVLVNAIYFKGEWASKFKPAQTTTDMFWIDGLSSIDAEMMYQRGSYWYKLDKYLDAQVIEIPYKGNDVKMMIILPTYHYIDKVETKLSKMAISEFGKDLELTEVHLFLPKFKIEETIQVNDVLSEMGLKSIFEMNKADFKGMVDTSSLKDNLHVSEVIQKVFIEVNEGGTVAAAATKAATALGCAPDSPPIAMFRVDRPAVFLLLSIHGEAKEPNVLFYGRLNHPKF